MLRQKFFTAINLIGLAAGSACFLLIYLYVADEYSYDQFHLKKDQLYRVNMTNIWIESNDKFGSTGPAVALAIKNDIPQVDNIVRLHAPYSFGDQIVSVNKPNGDRISFQESRILASDPDFFEVFTFPLAAGNEQTALAAPNSMIITEEYAEKYFQDRLPIGEQVTVGSGTQKKIFEITAVIRDLPDQSHFHFDFLVSMNSFDKVINNPDSWIWTTFITYLVIDEKADVTEVNRMLAQLPPKYVGQEEAARKNWTLELQAVTDIRLRSGDIDNRLGPVGSQVRINIFISVAILIMVLSCINFMNLSTARFGQRAKEIGLKKVLGSTQNQIRRQFLTESMLHSAIAVLFGFGLAELIKPFFNQLANKTLFFDLLHKPEIPWIMLVMIITTGLFAGSYPAWFMTRFKLVDSLKSANLKTPGKFNFRNSLVVFQFTISIALISTSLLVKDQLNFLDDQELGFNSDNLIVVEHVEWMKDQGKLFRNQVEEAGILTNPSITSDVPPYCWNQDKLKPFDSKKTDELAVTFIMTDAQFLSSLGLELVAGRNLFSEEKGDIQSVIINEKCAQQMEWISEGDDPEQVIGKKVSYYNDLEYQVVGIVKDFNFWTLNSPIEPLAIFHNDAPLWRARSFLVGRVPAEGEQAYLNTISQLEKTWNNINRGTPFEYHFVDQAFNSAFKGQQQFATVLNTFTFLAIATAILGLIGLISFTTEQRTKEFGIRKVLGARFKHLLGIISYDFIKLLLVAAALGSGITLYFGKEWLANFTYQTSISPFIFLISGAILLSLIITITFAITKVTTRKNPASVLKDD